VVEHTASTCLSGTQIPLYYDDSDSEFTGTCPRPAAPTDWRLAKRRHSCPSREIRLQSWRLMRDARGSAARSRTVFASDSSCVVVVVSARLGSGFPAARLGRVAFHHHGGEGLVRESWTHVWVRESRGGRGDGAILVCALYVEVGGCWMRLWLRFGIMWHSDVSKNTINTIGILLSSRLGTR